MSRRRGKPAWDMGDGWRQVKAEWQDVENAVEKTVTPEELKEMWCPAAGSTITIDMGHLLPNLKLFMDVGLKEYRPNPRIEGKYQYRKPTVLRSNVALSLGIPVPGLPTTTHNWCERKTWSSAVKTMIEEVIPSYEQAQSEAMSLWTVV